MLAPIVVVAALSSLFYLAVARLNRSAADALQREIDALDVMTEHDEARPL